MGKVIVIRHSDDETERNGNQVLSIIDYVKEHKNHFNDKLCKYACSKMKNSDGTNHYWSPEQIQAELDAHNLKFNSGSNIYDVTYTANMAYADFYPSLLDETKCIKYAIAVANDIDGYDGIQFSRWLADVACTNPNIDWNAMI